MIAVPATPATTTAVTMGAILCDQPGAKDASGKAMLQAAQKFRSTLAKEQLAKASFGFDDAERLNWHFIPRERKGLPLRELEGDSLKAAQELISSGLSKAGYEQDLSIMSIEEVLYLLEGGDRAERHLYLFGSHSHLDHTEGFDQAAVVFDPRNSLHIYGNTQFLRALDYNLGIFSRQVASAARL